MPVGSDEAKIFAGPETLGQREEWRKKLHDWRDDSRKRLNYDDSIYRTPNLPSIDSFNVALIWLWDELLFDFENQCFTPEKLITDSKKFGGLDGVILWHAYPVIGVDSRNQFDFYNEVPGLAELISNLQKLGVEVYLNYNPWDRWTSRPKESDQNEIASLVRNYKFDGVFLDTMKSADPAFMSPIYRENPHIIVAGESRVQQERICDHVMSWAQWFADSEIPGVIRAKWFERRHMLHQTRRWNQSHIDELHIAWLNGSGMLIWEVVFGSWVGWNERETRMWKEMVSILRKHNDFITNGVWEPLTKLSDSAELHGLYASKFTLNSNSLITIINKSDTPFTGEVVAGISLTIPGRGIGAMYLSNSQVAKFDFTYDQFSAEFPGNESSRLMELEGTLRDFEISYRNRECGLYDGAPFIDAWKPLPPNYHQIFTKKLSAKVRKGTLTSREVTNAEFHLFMQETGYQPENTNRFLKHWFDDAPTQADLNKPVTYIDLNDAKEYARWAGSVIPTEFEWQANVDYAKRSSTSLMNLTDSVHTDGRTRFLILKGGSTFNVRNGQGAKSTSGIAESDWYVDGGEKDPTWVEKLLLMGLGMGRSENISFSCFMLEGGN
ncbi:Sulfatase-modifying factor enzyme [Candidatus Nanopelagicaceae bacterium]